MQMVNSHKKLVKQGALQAMKVVQLLTKSVEYQA
jgi:hypothetical protein